MSDDFVYGDIKLDATYRILEGRPWRDAIITLLEPRSPYRPWITDDVLEPGDPVLLVLDTEPVSVVTAIGTVGPERHIPGTIRAIHQLNLNGLFELNTLKMLTPRDAILAAIDLYLRPRAVSLFGHSTLAAARVLLKSQGRCTACRSELDLTGQDARDRIVIRTVDLDAGTGELWNRDVRNQARDWPAVLCEKCDGRMKADGFTGVLDFIFAGRPRCPECDAQRAMTPSYGLPSGPIEEPWRMSMGCVVIEPRPKWVCGQCDHQWR